MRQVAEEISGQRSTRLLTAVQAAKVIYELEREIFWQSLRDKNEPDIEATGPQLWIVKKLFKELGIDTPQRQEGFCRRVIHKDWPEIRSEANKVYEALEAMWLREFKYKVYDMLLELESCGSLTDWEWEFVKDVRQQMEKRERLKSAGALHKLLEIYRKRSHDEKVLQAR